MPQAHVRGGFAEEVPMFRMLPMIRKGRAVARCAAGPMMATVAFAVLAVTVVGPWTARGAERVPGLTGTDRPDDVVQARQLIMDGIDAEMMPIDLFGTGKDSPLDELKEHADRISTMLTAFPHLFPPQTKPGAATADGSPSTTTARVEIWQNFDDFYGKAQAAAMTAFDATRAGNADEFKAAGKKLRAACDGCHAQYMKVDPPSPP
jgi:cytochrome c556